MKKKKKISFLSSTCVALFSLLLSFLLSRSRLLPLSMLFPRFPLIDSLFKSSPPPFALYVFIRVSLAGFRFAYDFPSKRLSPLGKHPRDDVDGKGSEAGIDAHTSYSKTVNQSTDIIG